MKNTIILINDNGMGRGEAPLQQTLIGNYLELLLRHDQRPAAICFSTKGVRLVCDDSPVLESLRALDSKQTR